MYWPGPQGGLTVVHGGGNSQLKINFQLATVGNPDGPVAVWRFDLTSATDGTRLRYSARLGPGKSGVTMMIEREPDRPVGVAR